MGGALGSYGPFNTNKPPLALGLIHQSGRILWNTNSARYVNTRDVVSLQEFGIYTNIKIFFKKGIVSALVVEPSTEFVFSTNR